MSKQSAKEKLAELMGHKPKDGPGIVICFDGRAPGRDPDKTYIVFTDFSKRSENIENNNKIQ